MYAGMVVDVGDEQDADRALFLGGEPSDGTAASAVTTPSNGLAGSRSPGS